MKTLKWITLSILLSFTFFNCSNDDDNNQDNPSIENFSRSINENPTEGLLIGTITTSNASVTNYNITSQSPNGALRVDPITGNLIVDNALLFDFETNPTITAVVKDSENNSTTNVTIDLININDIVHFLTTSKADYLAAEDYDWVAITRLEYNTLADRLNEVSTLGTTPQDYQTTNVSSIDNVTVTNVAGCPNLPENNFFFGFKYHSLSNNVVGARIRMSITDPLEGFIIGWGNPLPEHNMGDNYFVVKSNFEAGPIESEAYVAMFTPGNVAYIDATSDKSCYADNGDVSSFPSENIATGIIYLYQGLYTSQNQWEQQ